MFGGITMLLMFKVKNYTSFKNESILDMRATSYIQHPSHIIDVDEKTKLLKTASLYGANASGKSNFISAMFFFEQYIFSQFIDHRENDDIDAIEQQIKIKLEPFLLSNDDNDASEFDIIFIHNGKQIQYGFECTSKAVLNEWYYIDDKKVYERKDTEVTFGNKYQKMLSIYKRIPVERLYISVLEYFLDNESKEAILSDFIYFFTEEYNVFTEIFFESTVKKLASSAVLSQKLIDDKKFRNKVERYLRLIDVGIKRLDVQTKIVVNESTGKEKSIQRVVDTRELVTRLYAYGKDGLTFASINGGKEYVEDYTFSSEVRVSTLDCSSFTNPYQMLEYAKMRLAEYSKPRVSYVLSAMDLSALTGYEHEAWKLGDIVTVDDKELGLLVKTRVVRRQYNLQEPWKTVIELSTKLRELGDSSAQWDKAADALSSAELVNRQEIKDMVPFNHLRNSRADDGFAYWVNSGFEVDTENGVSGTASFKAVGVPGMTKSLSQTVYPATRKSYTFSAQIASENLEKGENGQVGVEIVIEYEDGTTETRFIDLI
jgi:hypothetical protein